MADTFFLLFLIAWILGANLFAFMQIHKKHQITVFDILAFILPLPLWAGLALSNLQPKSLSNVIEFLGLIILLPLILLIRAYWQGRATNQLKSRISLIASLLIVGAVYFFVPALPQ